jgi:D-alanyl-D-alanine dipeptidase
VVKVRDNDEKFVTLDPRQIPNGYLPEMSDMKVVFGPKIVVRKSVMKKLLLAQKELQKNYPNLSLYVTYGFRSLEIQTQRFLKVLRDQREYYSSPVILYETVHRFVAVPEVAGHPTGGAVDVIIKNQTGRTIDFGSQQYNYETKKCYVYAPDVDPEAKKNRMILRSAMMTSGFAPFNGEWWHFSFGDREWAFYFKKDKAFFAQKTIEQVLNLLVREEK